VLWPIIWYSRSLGLLAPITRGTLTYVQEPLEIGRRGCVARHLNGKYVSSGRRTLASVEGISRVRERCEYGSVSNGDKLIKYDLVCLIWFNKPVFNLSRTTWVNKATSNNKNYVWFGETHPFPERGPPTRLSNVGTTKLKRMIRYRVLELPSWWSISFSKLLQFPT
jgi:hypothetical protein